MDFKKLTQNNNNYEVNHKLPFASRTPATCSADDVKQAFLFSWNMTFGATGEHRSHRSGGKISRDNRQKFSDVFIGKLGEVAFYNVVKNREKVHKVTNIDYECYGLGAWESSDFVVNDQYHIAIKTTKHFGNLLLLEEKDWMIRDGKATYLPNQHSESKGIYDFLFFSRVNTDLHDLLNQIDISTEAEPEALKPIFLEQILPKVSVVLEVVGYVSNRNLVKMIEEEYILPQNAMLNGKTQMDASNYYLQSGFFREIPAG